MTARKHIRAFLGLFSVVALLFVATLSVESNRASAQDAAPTLQGEILNGDLFPEDQTDVTQTCDPNGNSTIHFDVTGYAAGPYPGLFRERGTILIGPQTGPPPAGFPGLVASYNTGTVLKFDSTFTIYSEIGEVTGTKSLTEPLGDIPNEGICVEASQQGETAFGCYSLDATYYEAAIRFVRATLRYEATIQTVTGTVEDAGIASALLLDNDVRGFAGEGQEVVACGNTGFTELFLLSERPVSTPGLVTGGGMIANLVGDSQVAFGRYAKSDDTGIKGNCNLVDQATDTHIVCLDATELIQIGTHATFSGNAKVNGVPTRYRIDVDDLNEPGIGVDTFKIETDSGYTVGGVLTEGNIQVHPHIPQQ